MQKDAYGMEVPETPAKPSAIFASKRRQRLNLVAICVNLILPWLVFCALFGVLSFSFHYRQPTAAWMIWSFGAVAVFIAASLSYMARKRYPDRAAWYDFSTLALAFAVASAAILGDMNFWYNMQPYYEIENLNTYPNINPAKEKGQQLMDAGRVYFSAGARLNSKYGMGFKNLDLYCVAPIVVGDEPIASYDFWAVGLNCCSGVASDFRCGEFSNVHARSGLRLMRDDQRPFFRLAVQQAEAAYKIKATHPLFFYWLQDPVAEMNSYRDDGFKYYLLGIFTHFAFNLFCVVSATMGFSKLK